MEYIDDKMNIFVKFLNKTDLISFDLIYRICFMPIFGSRLYFRHKITSFTSCAFCKHLSYDNTIKKYICEYGHYEACESIVPCIIPASAKEASVDNHLENEQTPWLFKRTCVNFEVLDSNKYYRNFISFDLNTTLIKLETLEGILVGCSGGKLPCHICASVNKEAYTGCSYIQKAEEIGKCSIVYENLIECFYTDTDLNQSRVS